MQHINEQNWFAVGLDVIVVVVGIFLGIQVSNWNAERQDQDLEQSILKRLETEFKYQETELELLAERLTVFKESARNVVVALENDAPPENEALFSEWLSQVHNLGRPPARSATYVQLLSSGDLDLLSNEGLRDLLVRYDQNIERNSFMYAQTLALLLATDKYLMATKSNIAEVENSLVDRVMITSFDFELLKSSEGKIEWLFYMHSNNLIATNTQIDIVKEILTELNQRGHQPTG
jgi:hypothetical protein